MKKLLAALLVAASPLPASAALIQYTFTNAVFNDGTTLTGGFGYDTATDTFATFDMTTTAGALAGYNYTAGTASFFRSGGAYGVGAPTNLNPYIRLKFDSALSMTGTHNLLLGFDSYECTNCGNYRTFVSGAVTSEVADVPEPAMLGLFGLGAIGLGLSRRRKNAFA